MIPYVYFGILLTEVEAECSSSFGSTGKRCKSGAEMYRNDDEAHAHLSKASLTVAIFSGHWPSSVTFFGNI
ncbi:unnamed protein product [Sphagnum jensenii]|uniref:Uncharacterized protein n=1 Tax=Sphagnum jensenii TaxID=128206 RepID=A0ABP0VMM6_9BRYO